MSVSSQEPSSWFCSAGIFTSNVLKAVLAEKQPDSQAITFTALVLTLTLLTAVSLCYLFLGRKLSTMVFSTCFGLLAAILITAPVLALDPAVNPDLNFKLQSQSPTRLDFLNWLSDDDMVYDFSNNPKYTWTPGSVCNANQATWPVLTGGGMSVAQLNLGPCAMLAPHLHPRATNLVVAVSGCTHTYMVQENGARLVQTVLTPGKMTIFPAASMHSMVNEGCGNNQLYSFLNSHDPGTLNIIQAFFNVGEDIGLQVMPMINLVNDDWNATAQRVPPIGTGSQEGYESCRKRCGLDGANGTSKRTMRMD